MKQSFWRKYGLAIGVGFFYGLSMRLIFGLPLAAGSWEDVFVVMSYAFVFIMPLVLGAVTVALAPPASRRSWVRWLFMPWLPCLLMLLAALVLGWEGLICVVFVTPIMLLLASIGGLLGGLLSRRGSTPTAVFASLLLLPLAVSPLEPRQSKDSLRTVRTHLVIHAERARVWKELVRVPTIHDHERRRSFFHAIGIPKPVEATLSYDGPGGIRVARFAQGIVFHETITEWEAERSLGFTVQVEPQSIPPQTLDEHVRVGERYFDVLSGRFQLDPDPTGGVLLTLSSRHRITTPFNWYAAWWSEWVMADIQQTICQVIKQRSEQYPIAPPRP